MTPSFSRYPLAALLAAAVLSVLPILPVEAQTIVIPDFRKSAPSKGGEAGKCEDCGVVRSVREVHRRAGSASRSPAGNAAGPPESRVVGAVMVLPFGAGYSPSNSRAFVGGYGTPEMNERMGELSYEIAVRMDDYTLRTVEQRDGGQFTIGDRVRVSDGRVEPLR